MRVTTITISHLLVKTYTMQITDTFSYTPCVTTLVRFSINQEAYDTAIQHPTRLMGDVHASDNAYRTTMYHCPRSIGETTSCPGRVF